MRTKVSMLLVLLFLAGLFVPQARAWVYTSWEASHQLINEGCTYEEREMGRRSLQGIRIPWWTSLSFRSMWTGGG